MVGDCWILYSESYKNETRMGFLFEGLVEEGISSLTMCLSPELIFIEIIGGISSTGTVGP